MNAPREKLVLVSGTWRCSVCTAALEQQDEDGAGCPVAWVTHESWCQA